MILWGYLFPKPVSVSILFQDDGMMAELVFTFQLDHDPILTSYILAFTTTHLVLVLFCTILVG